MGAGDKMETIKVCVWGGARQGKCKEETRVREEGGEKALEPF